MTTANRIQFEGGKWFAWFPVQVYNGEWRWLTTVNRDRIVTATTTVPWRYYGN
ncbi:MAG: hypothetical protein H5U22_06630 [Rhizobium sp.]|nr:hypothetical protein [Rhizobium sp.]